MKKIFWIIVFLFCFVGCHREEIEQNHNFEHITATDLKFDLVFPEPLWDLILKTVPQNTINVNKSTYDLFDSLQVNVQLIERHPGIFDDKSYQFDFKDFGGEIDWNNYLNRKENGSFAVKFYFPIQEEGVMRVFFMSWTKSFTKEGEAFGNGCNTILDLTSYFKKTIFKKGFLLHTKDSRYFFATAGRFYFVFYGKEKIKVAQVTFTDSSLKNKLCESAL